MGGASVDDRAARAFVARWLAWLKPVRIDDATGTGWDRFGEIVGSSGGPRVRVARWRDEVPGQFDAAWIENALGDADYVLMLLRPGPWAHPDDWARVGLVTAEFPVGGMAGAALLSRKDPLRVREVVGLMERPPEEGTLGAWRHALETVHARTMADAFTIAAIRHGAGHRFAAWMRTRGWLARTLPRVAWWRPWTVVRVWGTVRLEGVHARAGEPAMPWDFVWRAGEWRADGEVMVCEGAGLLAVVGEDVIVRARGVGDGGRAAMQGPLGRIEETVSATATVVLRVGAMGA